MSDYFVYVSAPTHLLFYVLADEGIVAFKDLGGSSTLDRNIVGRSIRPVAVAYDPVEQVSCKLEFHMLFNN